MGWAYPPPILSEVRIYRKSAQVRKNGLTLQIFCVAGLDRGGVCHTNEFIGKYQLAMGLVLNHY
jgi:hypothetical protein